MGIAESSHNNILLELMNHVSEMIAETIGESRRIILYGEQTTSERLIEEHQVIYDAVLKARCRISAASNARSFNKCRTYCHR